jgi:putrescine transport system substrate-binding protein
MAEVSDYIRYANANLKSTPLLSVEVRDNPAIYPDAQTRERLFTQKIQTPASTRLITRTWNMVKIGK